MPRKRKPLRYNIRPDSWYAARSYKPRRLYMHEITPADFLRLAAGGRYMRRRKEESHGWGGTSYYQKLLRDMKTGQRIEPVNLWIDNDCQVGGHEGRHRASTAEKLGIKRIPIVLVCRNTRGCDHCYKDFPSKLIPQSRAGWRTSRRVPLAKLYENPELDDDYDEN